jgi:excinuclease ABC subunit C
MRDRHSELLDIPGIGKLTTRRLVEHFGSVRAVRQADPAALSAVLNKKQTEAILCFFREQDEHANEEQSGGPTVH